MRFSMLVAFPRSMHTSPLLTVTKEKHMASKACEGGIDRSPEGQGRVVDTARVVVWTPANMLLGLHSLFKVKSPSLGI